MLVLRVHHLLCTGLFSGHGYSPEYTEHLTRVIATFKNHEYISLTTNCDTVCSVCPKRKHDGTDFICADDDNYVHIKDTLLLEPLGLEEGKPYKVSELKKILDTKLTKEVFDKSCSNCPWYKQGYCTFEDWKNPLN